MTKVKVLLADENKGFGGAERHVLTLARELLDQGILEALVARPQSWLAQNRGELPFHPVGFRNEVDMLSVFSIYRRIKSANASVLHCIGHRDLVASALARQLPGAPPTVLIKAEHSYPDSNLSPLFRWAYGQCTAITTVSEALREATKSAVNPTEKTRMVTIHNGIEPGPAVEPRPPTPGRPLRIGVLSPLRPGKGHQDFLQAASRLQEETFKLHFSIAGDGELLEELKHEAARRKLEVEFPGHLENPMDYLASLDLSVVPSHRETFSLVTLESMVCGRPIVAANSAGVGEICRDYPAELYPAGDTDALYHALARFCTEPDGFLERALAAAEKARENFHSARMATTYHSLYSELLSA